MTPRGKPNIVFILADDMGYGDFSRFHPDLSGEARTTPSLDAMVDESVCLTQHYTASPVCNPSRACLMTGRYPHRTGSIDTLEWRGLERLALREVTLADLLKQAGYTTGLIGKWHLGAYDIRYSPTRRGFDESVCFRGGMHDYYDWRIEANDTPRRSDGRYLTDVWTDEAVAFLERHRREPFFLHVTYNAPHTPLQCPAEDVEPFRRTERFNEATSILYGMIRRMDAGIARILEALEGHGLHDNTIVVFTSDNGPAFGSEKGDTTRFNAAMRGHKGVTYEGGIRVPMLMRWPAGLDGGRRVDEMVHFADYLATFLAAAGAEPPSDLELDGVNVLDVLRGEKGETVTQRFWQWNRYTPLVTCNAAHRDGDWKLVRPAITEAMHVTDYDIECLKTSMYNYEHFVENGILGGPYPPRDVPDPPTAQLFDLAEDPYETTDLAETHPDRARRMLTALEGWFEEVEAERATIRDG